MSPLRACEWIGVAFLGFAALALAVEMVRPARRQIVRAAVIDPNAAIVSTVSYVVGEEPAEARLPDGLRLVVEMTGKK